MEGNDHRQPDSLETASPSSPQTVIGRSTFVKGDLSAAEDLRIEGEVRGRILVPGHMARIGKAGRVTGEVLGATIIVEGRANGDLYASEKVILCQSAEVKGRITSARLVLEEGCRFNGKAKVDPSTISESFARARKQMTAAFPAQENAARSE